MSFLDIKAKSRRAVHARFAVPCSYTNTDGTFSITARLHDRITVGGDLNSEGYAAMIEGVTRVVFNREELETAGLAGAALVPARNDTVTFPDYLGAGQYVSFTLDNRDPYDGPIDEKWTVGPI